MWKTTENNFRSFFLNFSVYQIRIKAMMVTTWLTAATHFQKIEVNSDKLNNKTLDTLLIKTMPAYQ